MRRFQSLLEQYPDRALYVPEICEAIRVPERTFRLCCQEHLGMVPEALPDAPAHAPGSPCAETDVRIRNDGNPDRNTFRLLAFWPFRDNIPIDV